ncbi:MAG: nicotinate (nicotinamide) nucleotide adenylyltransferase [Polyangiaceae bacterium]
MDSVESKRARRVAVYGGSFNPPHVSHVLAVVYTLSTQPIDEVLVVPCAVHPFAKELAGFEERFAMCQAAMGWIPNVTISRIEHELGGESRTLRTLEHLREAHPDWQLRLVVGADILGDTRKWFAFERVCELAPLLVLGREGVDESRAPKPVLPEVSSTQIRAALASRDRASIASLVPAAVLDYIEAHGLYGASSR